MKFWQGFLGRVVVVFLSGVAAKERLTSYTFVAKENKYVCEAVDRLTQSSCSADNTHFAQQEFFGAKSGLDLHSVLASICLSG